MDNKTKEAIRQLQAEIRQLHVLISSHQTDGRVELSGADEVVPGRQDKSDAVVQYCVKRVRSRDGSASKKASLLSFTAAQLSRVRNEEAAALASAVASPQKVALLRALLEKETESAAALGEATHLSTGSLYHHLRELMRADLIHQSGRNCYVLAERGARVLWMLLALAADASGG